MLLPKWVQNGTSLKNWNQFKVNPKGWVKFWKIKTLTSTSVQPQGANSPFQISKVYPKAWSSREQWFYQRYYICLDFSASFQLQHNSLKRTVWKLSFWHHSDTTKPLQLMPSGKAVWDNGLPFSYAPSTCSQLRRDCDQKRFSTSFKFCSAFQNQFWVPQMTFPSATSWRWLHVIHCRSDHTQCRFISNFVVALSHN